MTCKDQTRTDQYWIVNSDCMEVLPTMPAESVDLSIYSPPFAGLYNYSSSERDFSNCENKEQFLEQYDFLIAEMARVTKPGRINAVHCTDVFDNSCCFPHVLHDTAPHHVQRFVHLQWAARVCDGFVCVQCVNNGRALCWQHLPLRPLVMAPSYGCHGVLPGFQQVSQGAINLKRPNLGEVDRHRNAVEVVVISRAVCQSVETSPRLDVLLCRVAGIEWPCSIKQAQARQGVGAVFAGCAFSHACTMADMYARTEFALDGSSGAQMLGTSSRPCFSARHFLCLALISA